ncbi:MAG: hypothetical protein HUJ63_13930, partial [Enterococcus sp.]|nr:hypothetical protein [Enterococcus sp.]
MDNLDLKKYLYEYEPTREEIVTEGFIRVVSTVLCSNGKLKWCILFFQNRETDISFKTHILPAAPFTKSVIINQSTIDIFGDCWHVAEIHAVTIRRFYSIKFTCNGFEKKFDFKDQRYLIKRHYHEIRNAGFG